MKLVTLLGVLLIAGCAAAPKPTMEKVAAKVVSEPKPACQSGHNDALSNGVITIRPGETICVALEKNGAGVHLTRVVASADTQDILVMKFWREPGSDDMYLSVHNPLHAFLRYRAELVRPGSLQSEYTSSCPVMSGGLGLENWPYAIAALTLSDFEAMPNSQTIECK